MRPKEILIIDDEPDLNELLVECFTNQGWITSSAPNGRIALELILQRQPNVVISDIHMPDMDGIELLERVYELKLDMPIILVTGFRTMQNMQRAWQACVFDFLDKPLHSYSLLQAANNAHECGEEYIAVARKRFQRNLHFGTTP